MAMTTMSTEELEFRTIPVVSTAHITSEDDELLSRPRTLGHIDGALRFGYMLRVSTNRGDWHGDMSEGFMGLMRFIHANGFEWVILDRDGPVISTLPTYEW